MNVNIFNSWCYKKEIENILPEIFEDLNKSYMYAYIFIYLSIVFIKKGIYRSNNFRKAKGNNFNFTKTLGQMECVRICFYFGT